MSAEVDELKAVNPQTIDNEEESVHSVNGEVDSQNGEIEELTQDSNSNHVSKDGETDKDTDPNESINELKNKNQNHEIVLIEYERVKDELLKLQNEYKSSLEREKTLCERLKIGHDEEDVKVSQLSKVNEDLREQFDNLVEELNGKKDDLKE